jgi:hypothetical protein
MPSWYNLFFATYGTWALLKHRDSGRTRWLFLAGACGGLSILAKITGLYFVAAGLLYLAYREQSLCREHQRRSVGFSAMMTAWLTAFGLLGLMFLKGQNPVMSVIHFFLPLAGLAGLVAWSEWRRGRGAFGERLLRLVRLVLPFVAGVTAILACFMIPYIRAGSVGSLYHGVFVLPRERFQHAAMPLPGLPWLVLALPLAKLFFDGMRRRQIYHGRDWWVVTAGLVGLIAVSYTDAGYHALFQAVRHQIPVVVLTALAVLIVDARQGQWFGERRESLFLLAAVAMMTSLVQFPYAFGVYFFFAAPLAVLAALFVVTSQPNAPRWIHVSVLVFLIAFAVLRIDRPSTMLGGRIDAGWEGRALQLERSHLTCRSDRAHVYHKLVPLVQAHAPSGSYIFATPDCPEVYFLTGRKNPSRVFFDFFDTGEDRCGRILEMVDRHHVPVVVINRFPDFSSAVDPQLLAQIEAKFTHSAGVTVDVEGRTDPVEKFRVYWRDPAEAPSNAIAENQSG